MKNSYLISFPFLKFQSIVYLFIIFWAILIKNVQSLFVVWKYTEEISVILFFMYILVALGSVILLIMQVLKIYFSLDNSLKKKIWIVANIVLYYGVLFADLLLSTQIRF